MILIFALAGTFTAMIAGVSALVMGQPWWIGLASYVAAGIITVCFLAVFSAFSTKAGQRKAEGPRLGAGMPIGEH